MRRLVLLVLLAALAPAADAGALTDQQVFGIGGTTELASPRLAKLQPGATRQNANWDVARTPGYERDRVDAWYAAALTAGMEPLLAFQGLNEKRAPTLRRYTRAFRAALARWPQMAQWAAWNEGNHATQPATWKHPRRAARYAKALERACPGCTILPITIVLSESDLTRRWIRRFLDEYGRTPRIWAVHTYGDVNRRTDERLRAFLKRYPRGRVWIAETGAFATFDPRWPYDLARQARLTRFAFGQALRFRRRVDRMYWWEWRGRARPRRVHWDTGLVDVLGRPRPAFRAALKARFRTR